jgi:hypothetical protein
MWRVYARAIVIPFPPPLPPTYTPGPLELKMWYDGEKIFFSIKQAKC